MGPCCCTICKYKSSSAYKIFKHRIRKGSLTVSVEPLGKLVALVKASLFLKGVQHIETANISLSLWAYSSHRDHFYLHYSLVFLTSRDYFPINMPSQWPFTYCAYNLWPFLDLPLTAVGFLGSPHLPYMESSLSTEADAVTPLPKSSPAPKLLLLPPQSYSCQSMGNSLPSPIVHPCAAENSLRV